MDLKGNELNILKYLSGKTLPVTTSFIKNHFLAFGVDNISNAKDLLVEKKYILINDNIVTLTKKAEDYIKEYDNFGEIELLNEPYEYVVMYFFYSVNSPVYNESIPKLLMSYAPVNGKAESDRNKFSHYMMFSTNCSKHVKINSNNEYCVTEQGKAYFKNEILKREKILLKNNLQDKIDTLTLDNLNFQSENKGLNKQLIKSELQLNTLQSKEIKTKRIWSTIGFLGGAIFTYLLEHSKEVLILLKRLFDK